MPYLGTRTVKRRLLTPDRSTASPVKERHIDAIQKISFANESQFLLVVEQSVVNLLERLANSDEQFDFSYITERSFRPNIVVRSEMFADDTWKRIRIGTQCFTATGISS